MTYWKNVAPCTAIDRASPCWNCTSPSRNFRKFIFDAQSVIVQSVWDGRMVLWASCPMPKHSLRSEKYSNTNWRERSALFSRTVKLDKLQSLCIIFSTIHKISRLIYNSMCSCTLEIDNLDTNESTYVPRFASSVVMEAAYGHQISSPDDPYLKAAKCINEMVSGLGTQGANPVDIFPFCK